MDLQCKNNKKEELTSWFEKNIEKQEISKEEQRFQDIADNIDAYNGTSIGQKRIGG